MPNPFAHIELTTDDLKAAQKFYGKVFAWKLSEMPGMSYTMIDVGGGTGGGMQSKPMPEAPTGWMPYVQVDDVKATVAKATKAGATAMLPYQEIGEMGAIGVFADPNGAVIGVWEAKQGSPAAAPPKKKAAAKKAAKKATAKKPAASARGKKAAQKAAPPAPAKKAPGSKKKK
jgi:predicted enzyme related to lactoylglutathione lyase